MSECYQCGGIGCNHCTTDLPVFVRTVDDRVRGLECVISDLTAQAKEDHKRISEFELECVNAKNYMVELSSQVTKDAKCIGELKAAKERIKELDGTIHAFRLDRIRVKNVTSKRIAELEAALRNIMQHQEIAGAGLSHYSAAYMIAKTALDGQK